MHTSDFNKEEINSQSLRGFYLKPTSNTGRELRRLSPPSGPDGLHT